MSIADVFIATMIIGGVVAMTSRGRVSSPELSLRMTGWGWLLVGIGLSGYAVFAPTQYASAWRQLEMLWHFGVGVCGLLFVLFGLRRLRRTGSADPQLTPDDPSGPARRRAWRLVWVGVAIMITLLMLAMFVPGLDEQDFDGSPRSLGLYGAGITGALLAAAGAVMLRRLNQRRP